MQSRMSWMDAALPLRRVLPLLIVGLFLALPGQASAGKGYGQSCRTNNDCSRRRCDMAPGNPHKCIPNDGTGKKGDYCTHNNHCLRGMTCASRRCGGSRCKKGYKWMGIDNNIGACVKFSNLMNIHRHGYYTFFQFVSRGVQLKALPAYFVKDYSRHFKYVRLADVRVGKSRATPSSKTAITDCKKIYLPAGLDHYDALMGNKLANRHYYLILHELAHANQCMKIAKPTDGSTKRDRYADMWFGQLPKSVFAAILKGKLTDTEIHDRMPMEKDATAQANAIIRKTGKGKVQ